MKTTDATKTKTTKSYGCRIGRRSGGGFYVIQRDNFLQVCRWSFPTESLGEVVSWIEQRFGA